MTQTPSHEKDEKESSETRKKKKMGVGVQVGKEGNATRGRHVEILGEGQIPCGRPIVAQPQRVGNHAKETHARFDEENDVQGRVDRLVHQGTCEWWWWWWWWWW